MWHSAFCGNMDNASVVHKMPQRGASKRVANNSRIYVTMGRLSRSYKSFSACPTSIWIILTYGVGWFPARWCRGGAEVVPRILQPLVFVVFRKHRLPRFSREALVERTAPSSNICIYALQNGMQEESCPMVLRSRSTCALRNRRRKTTEKR